MEGTPPRPKSPPECTAVHYARVQFLEKEISSLQEELKSLDSLQPSSRCCQEVNEFVSSRLDPLTPRHRHSHKSDSCWATIWGKPCMRPTKWNCCSNYNSTSRANQGSLCCRNGSSVSCSLRCIRGVKCCWRCTDSSNCCCSSCCC